MIITIDGPTASGKSTIAGLLAEKLHAYYVNSGLLYRSLAYLLVTQRGYAEKDLQDVKQEDIDYCMDQEKYSYVYDDKINKISVFYQNNNIVNYLKDSSVDHYVALISSQKLVRETMVKQQHQLALHHSVVTDGRDVGSHVFPNADYKFYITASLEVRAYRWQQDQAKRNNQFTLKQAQLRISERDMRDLTRTISPLIIPQDGIVIDSSNFSVQETLEKVMSFIK